MLNMKKDVNICEQVTNKTHTIAYKTKSQTMTPQQTQKEQYSAL